MDLIISLLLASLTLLAISLQRTYGAVPSHELKRRSQKQDVKAARLHQAAAYGSSLRAVVWCLVIGSSAGFFVFTSRHLSAFTAFVASLIVVWIGFVWLNQKEVKQISLWFASLAAPFLAWLLHYLHSPISWIEKQLRRYSQPREHTGLYDKEDLLEFLNRQNAQIDNRINEVELELTFHALTFSNKVVREYMTPRRLVKSINANDSIGPILMSELHESGAARFPVYEGKKDHLVGTLFLKDLVSTKATAKVKDVMRQELCYIHEDQSLYDALQAILKTRQHLLIVINSEAEYVGVLMIEEVLEQAVGNPVIDNFDQYEDARAVATRGAEKPQPDAVEATASVTTDDEVIE